MKFRALSFLAGPMLLALNSSAALAGDDKGCVWRLDGPSATVYLAGSIHLLRESDHPLPSTYEKAYAQAKNLIFEVDLATMRSIEGQRVATKLGMLPAGERLDEWLKPKTLETLNAYLEKRGVAASQLNRLRPGMLAMTITSTEAMRIGAQPQFGVEAVFDEKARADGKSIRGLETLEFQIKLFNNMSRVEQDRLLEMTLEEVEDTPSVLSNMISAWRAGDGPKLQEELNRHFQAEDEPLMKRLLYDRNASWIPVIEDVLKAKENTLIIVGAGHLVGPRSVITLLETKGYKPVQWDGTN